MTTTDQARAPPPQLSRRPDKLEEVAKLMQQDIAKTIREGWSPQLTEAMKLPEQARRLDAALKVAEKWQEASKGSPEMWAQAGYTLDKIEEELSRVCFQMEVESQESDFGEGRGASAALSNSLLEAYCILRDVPADLIRDGSPRARYGLMGALMVAQDIVNAQTEHLEAQPEQEAQ
jgi:hypothetical protein